MSWERAMDPTFDPERRAAQQRLVSAQMHEQGELPFNPPLPKIDPVKETESPSPHVRGWVTESNASLAAAMREAAARLEKLSDMEYFAKLDKQYPPKHA